MVRRSSTDAKPAAKPEPLLYCPCCAAEAGFFWEKWGKRFPVRAGCTNASCGVTTANVCTVEIAAAIWNRRVKRKPPLLRPWPPKTKRRKTVHPFVDTRSRT